MPEIEISEEINDIISHQPSWLIRKSSLLLLFVVTILLGSAWFISYPVIVTTPGKIIAVNPPLPVITTTNGRIIRLLVQSETMVQKEQPLALINNPADFDEVMSLKKWTDTAISKCEPGSPSLLHSPYPSLFNLGEIQTTYQQLENELSELTQSASVDGYYNRKKIALQKDLQYLSRIHADNQRQQNLQSEERALKQKQLNAYETLANEKVIAPLELDQYKSQLISTDQYLRQLHSQATGNAISSQVTQRELLALEKQLLDRQQKAKDALLSLKSAIDNWIQQYVIIAPANGKLIFISSTRINEPVEANQILFYVAPANSDYYVESMATQQQIGKLQHGQDVRIEADGYPREEFGFLSGQIEHIAPIAGKADQFVIRIKLNQALITNYKKRIEFRSGLTVRANIITEERKLIEMALGKNY